MVMTHVLSLSPLLAYFFFGRTFDLVFSQTVALRMRDYALSRDSAYCLPTFQLYRVTQVVALLQRRRTKIFHVSSAHGILLCEHYCWVLYMS